MAGSDLVRGYATALFQVAGAEDALDRVSDELFQFAKTVEQNHELRNSLTDIAVSVDRKVALVEDILGDRVSEHTRNVLGFVISQGRTRQLTEIVEQLVALPAESSKKAIAEVRTAAPLSDEQKQKLGHALGQATGKSVEVKVVVDPAVLGGVYAKVGDQVIDGTVRRRLSDLAERFDSARTK